MRRDWIARWEGENGQITEYCFVSLEWLYIARISLEIDLLKRNMPVPTNYVIQPLGEPYSKKRKPIGEE